MSISPCHIAYACDRNHVEHVTVSLCSLFENTQGVAFIVHVLNVDIDPILWAKLAGIVKKYGHEVLDVKIEDFELDGLPIGNHFSRANYYRLFLQSKVQESKILYLDADTIIVRPVTEIYNLDISNVFVAAVADYGIKPHQDLDMSIDANYFNSGVMLINLDAWRSFDVKGKVIDLVRRAPWAIQYVDQCGLNSVINGQWRPLPIKFNAQQNVLSIPFEESSNPFPRSEWTEAMEAPVIVHYSGPVKPWHFRARNSSRKLYASYLKKTPFNRRFSKDLTVPNLVKWCFPLQWKLVAKRCLYKNK